MKHELTADKNLNPRLKEQVVTVRGGILTQTLKLVTGKYQIIYSKDQPEATIKVGNKQATFGLFELSGVLRALNTFLI